MKIQKHLILGQNSFERKEMLGNTYQWYFHKLGRLMTLDWPLESTGHPCQTIIETPPLI